MFYEPKNGHGLPRNPFKACVVPRPIGWISTLDTAGRPNLAPYSYFNAVSDEPPVVLFSGGGAHVQDGGLKDTVANAEETGEFVFNMATWNLREAMNFSSATFDREVDEFAETKLSTLPSTVVKPPRISASPIHLECKTLQVIEMPAGPSGRGNRVVFGEVVGVHIDDSVLRDGFVDTARIKPIARLGYMEYAVVEQTFVMERPVLQKA